MAEKTLDLTGGTTPAQIGASLQVAVNDAAWNGVRTVIMIDNQECAFISGPDDLETVRQAGK
jgi:hypothetical protein